METTYRYVALASRVIAVAVIYEWDKEAVIGWDWSAYIDAVDGYDHSEEYMDVARHGDKLPKAVAVILFPQYDEKHWRD
jgi:hypothetical protein